MTRSRSSRSAAPALSFDPRLRYSLRDAAALLGISRMWLHRLVEDKKVRPIRDGRRRFISGADIERLCRPPGARP